MWHTLAYPARALNPKPYPTAAWNGPESFDETLKELNNVYHSVRTLHTSLETMRKFAVGRRPL